jgi:hypothetical protein
MLGGLIQGVYLKSKVLNSKFPGSPNFEGPLGPRVATD